MDVYLRLSTQVGTTLDVRMVSIDVYGAYYWSILQYVERGLSNIGRVQLQRCVRRCV